MRVSIFVKCFAVITALASISIVTAPAQAIETKNLYRAETLVTGTEEPERTRGFGIGLEEVLIKLSGDARLGGSRRLAPYRARMA